MSPRNSSCSSARVQATGSNRRARRQKPTAVTWSPREKHFASQSAVGELLVTSAPFGDEVLHFSLPMNAQGVNVLNDWRALGMRGTASHTVQLDNVFVPDAAIVLSRPRGVYHPVWNIVLTVAMPLIMSVYVGIAQHAAKLALDHVRRRKNARPQAPSLLSVK